MRITWPCDFEEKVKMPAAVGGTGYPYRISAEDLMDNFKAAADVVPEGLNVGDVLYWDGFKWQLLEKPDGDGYYLASDGAEPEWKVLPSAAGSGWWGEVILSDNGYYSNSLKLKFENGALVSVRFITPIVDEFIEGTESSPGSVEFLTN